MGELNVKKQLCCLICDSDVDISQSYSIFYTFITNSGILLANSLEKNLSLKDIGSLPLRSHLICFKCFEYFEELTNCESKIIKLKGDLWTVYKETCEKHGEKAETHVQAVSTQTDFNMIDCNCSIKNYKKQLNLKSENNLQYKESNNFESETGCENHFNVIVNEIKIETNRAVEEIMNDVPLFEKEPSKWMEKPESCKLSGKWFKNVTELQSQMVNHENPKIQNPEKNEFTHKTRKKFHSCTVCNKKFRRPCEVKEHMISHKCTTPFVCKYCGKKLKSKTGAIYHTLKTHRIDIGNNKKLEEHFYLDITKNKERGNYLSASQGKGNMSDGEGNTKICVPERDSSASEDELPLARRRKEFMFEKLKKDISSEKAKNCKSKSKQNQREAFQTLKKFVDVAVKTFPNDSNRDSKEKFGLFNKNDIDVSPVVEKDGNKEAQFRISKSTNLNEIVPQQKTEVSDSDESKIGEEDNATKEKIKNRTKKYAINNVLKIKRQKDASLLPPPMKEPKFKCDICGKMWKTRGELNAHKITHSDARPYICEICGQAYKHKPALDVHVGMHRGIYHHQCPYCQKAFTQKGALQRHLPIHTGDLPYQCELCGKRFVHRTSFSIHTMAHTGIRNIRCKICNLGVLSKSHLRRHMRIHTGEKPYDCKTCGKAFAERYNLVAHQRIHDPNLVGPARQQKKKPQTCRLCNATFDRRHKLEDHMVSIHNKVVEDISRTSIFASGEAYTGTRMTESFDNQKPQPRETEDKPNPVGNTNDLSVRNLQSIHNSHLRNLELLRNLENGRNLELIRMANGIGTLDETLRISGTGSTLPWTYINPGS